MSRKTFGGSAGGGKHGPGGGLRFQKNEPSFITKMKQEAGFREAVPDINDKCPDSEKNTKGMDPDEPERDDERPTVVVLKDGDLTAEEAEEQWKRDSDKREEDEPPSDGRIVFKKPLKRKGDPDKEEESDSKSHKRKSETSKSGKANKGLLSFDEEEDDD